MAARLEQSLKQLSISSDANAQIFALLEQDKFVEALHVAQAKEAKNVSSLYTAYIQYRLGHEEECLKILGDARDRASRHLRAQALYRLERVSLADLSTLRTDLVVDNELADIEVNELAIAAQNALLNTSDQEISASITTSSHEALFNRSIYLSASGKTEEALQCLEQAVKALKTLELDETDYQFELAPIHAQLAHLTSDSNLNEQVRTQETDSTTRYMTGINFLESDNPFALYKAYHAQTHLRPSARLFSYQDRYIAYDKIVNMSTIGLSVKKAVRSYCSKYSKVEPDRCSALKSLMYARSTKQSLRARIQENPSDIDAVVALLSKTIASRQGVSKSIAIIEAIPAHVRDSSPGLLGIWAGLSDLTPNSQSQTIIDNALKSASESTREELLAGSIQSSLAKAKSDAKLDASIQARARELSTLNPDNLIAQSIQSISEHDESAEIMQLPDLSSIDVVSLELGTKRALDAKSTSTRSSKKVKTKTPEQIEAASKLDPERWLPKRDRSNYKPTKKDKLRAAGGHQGGIVDESLANQTTASTTKSSEVPRKKKNKKGKK